MSHLHQKEHFEKLEEDLECESNNLKLKIKELENRTFIQRLKDLF